MASSLHLTAARIGQSWNFGLFDLNVLCIALSPHLEDDETVLAGAETGLYRSANGGRAWRETAFPTDKAPILCLAFIDDGAAKILAGTEITGFGSLAMKAKAGLDWRRNHSEAVNDIQIVHRSDGSRRLFALVDDGLLASADDGQTWRRLMQTSSAQPHSWPRPRGLFSSAS